MIIQLRGNHASGKSTVVRKILGQFKSTPIYGVLGPRFPEAYRCDTGFTPLYILGPYSGTATCGADYTTKKGMDTLVAQLIKYSAKGHVLFESILTSVRFGQVGEYLEGRKKDVLIVVLDVPLEECLKALAARQKVSTRTAPDPGNAIHIRAHDRQFELTLKRMEGLGFDIRYVKRDVAPDQIVTWLKELSR